MTSLRTNTYINKHKSLRINKERTGVAANPPFIQWNFIQPNQDLNRWSQIKLTPAYEAFRKRNVFDSDIWIAFPQLCAMFNFFIMHWLIVLDTGKKQ